MRKVSLTAVLSACGVACVLTIGMAGPAQAAVISKPATAAIQQSATGSAPTIRSMACGSWIRAAALNTGWHVSRNASCALAGSRTTKVRYDWERDGNAIGGSICVQARGARIPAANPSWGGVLYWHAGGCAVAGSVTVDWQSSLHYKEIRHFASGAPVWGVGFEWR